jgi:nicotinate dehydrogenase subunit A
MGVTLTVNGTPVEVQVDGATPLILALRNELGLKGTRFGCGGEDCGACTVLVDSEPKCSCTLQLDDVAQKRVTTIEGLNDRLSEVLRDAILAESAGQCGYCLSGIFITPSPRPRNRNTRKSPERSAVISVGAARTPRS